MKSDHATLFNINIEELISLIVTIYEFRTLIQHLISMLKYNQNIFARDLNAVGVASSTLKLSTALTKLEINSIMDREKRACQVILLDLNHQNQSSHPILQQVSIFIYFLYVISSSVYKNPLCTIKK